MRARPRARRARRAALHRPRPAAGGDRARLCATAAFEQSPILTQLIANRTADTLELTNGVSVEVRAASFRRLRGPTYIAVIADEAAFWYSDEFSANADAEILNAVRPGLATTGGPLIIASSPYAKRGVLWETYRRHYGPDGDPLILVAQGTSRDFNPSLPQSVVDRALERDHASASAEYLAQFRTDIEGFVSFEVVQACVHRRSAIEMAASAYCATPPSSIHPAAVLTASHWPVAHRDGERIVVDATARGEAAVLARGRDRRLRNTAEDLPRLEG